MTTARILLESEYNLAEACFANPITFGSYDALIEPVSMFRGQFIDAARKTLRLRVSTGMGSFDKNVSWAKFRSSLGDMSDAGTPDVQI